MEPDLRDNLRAAPPSSMAAWVSGLGRSRSRVAWIAGHSAGVDRAALDPNGLGPDGAGGLDAGWEGRGRIVRGSWEARGRIVGGSWEARGRIVGGSWELYEPHVRESNSTSPLQFRIRLGIIRDPPHDTGRSAARSLKWKLVGRRRSSSLFVAFILLTWSMSAKERERTPRSRDQRATRDERRERYKFEYDPK